MGHGKYAYCLNINHTAYIRCQGFFRYGDKQKKKKKREVFAYEKLLAISN